MFVSATSAATVVRLAGRFDAHQARSLEQMLAMFKPVRHVVIDFGNVREADDAAVANLARTLGAFRESRVGNLADVALRGAQHGDPLSEQCLGRKRTVSAALQADEFRDVFHILAEDELAIL